MKTKLDINGKQLASSLIIVFFICTLLSLFLMFYMQLLQQQTMLSARSQTWNTAMAVVEAGIEEGIELVNGGSFHPTADGWTADDKVYTRSQTLADGNSYFVTVYMTNGNAPVVVAQANITLPALAQNAPAFFFAAVGVPSPSAPTVVKRAVRVICAKPALFTAGVIVQHGIDLKGNGVYTDSYNSQDPNKSTNGHYDSGKYSGDQGDVSSNGGISDSVSVQNGNIYGKVHTGPGCPVSIGPNGGVGPHGSQTSSTNLAVQKGYIVQDANFTFPDTTLPNTSHFLPPTGGYVFGRTNYYDNILYANNSYVVSSLSGKTFVAGSNVTLALPNGMTGVENISLNTNANILIYAGGTSFSAAGNQIINPNGYAGSFIVYCAPSVKTFSLAGNGTFTGVLVAPSADVSLKGSGNNNQDFCGSLVANSIVMNGHFSFHYDESLSSAATNRRYLISAWDEIAPQ